MKTKLLNLGCGDRFHEDWVNLDHCPADMTIIRCDIRGRLPFEAETFDGVYSSHVLEHLDKRDSLAVAKEIFRVLKVGGVCRIVVPDYQDCVSEYLSVLERAIKGEDGADLDYEWIVIEMVDQFTRTTYGGEMARYIAAAPKNLPYVESRIGTLGGPSYHHGNAARLGNRLIAVGWVRIFEILRARLAGFVVRLCCGRKYAAMFREALFRGSGELHKSVWDGYSLSNLFEQAGFVDIRRCTVFESGIDGFDKYGLDWSSTDSKGVIRPHSLYLEAKKK